MKNYSPKTRASALLISFFIMTLLVLSALGVNLLVTHDVASVRTFTAGVQSRYAAEGMNERGLYSMKMNLPGYEQSFNDVVLANESTASLSIHAREGTVPCTGQSEDNWIVLDRNESISLPLFAQTDAKGNTEKILKFFVEFYVGDENGDTSFAPSNDVLRWKILGLQDGRTDAISEYIPLDTGNSHTNKESPSVFGTAVSGAVPTGYTYAKYYSTGYPATFYPTYSIEDFLEGHSYSYLVVTNMVQREDENTLFVRLTSLDVKAVCSYSALSSSGWKDFGQARQELITLVKEGENLPVFDFVLYHTTNSGGE